MAELKKCPFCGSERIMCFEKPLEFLPMVSCSQCHAMLEDTTIEEAIIKWNNRATEAEIRAKAIDEFKERMKKSCLEECWVAELWGGRKVNVLGMEILNMINEIAKELKENE